MTIPNSATSPCPLGMSALPIPIFRQPSDEFLYGSKENESDDEDDYENESEDEDEDDMVQNENQVQVPLPVPVPAPDAGPGAKMKMTVTFAPGVDEQRNRSILKQDNILCSIADRFKYIKQLGSGASCRVLLCAERATNKLFALKELPKKNKLSAMQFDREVRLLLLLRSKCDHTEHIMKYIDCYMDKHCYYIVLEYCSGPTLFQRVISINILMKELHHH